MLCTYDEATDIETLDASYSDIQDALENGGDVVKQQSEPFFSDGKTTHIAHIVTLNDAGPSAPPIGNGRYTVAFDDDTNYYASSLDEMMRYDYSNDDEDEG